MKAQDWDKIAKVYFKELSSPFNKGQNKIINNKIGKGNNVIDLGTGIGNLLPYLAKNFKSVHAVDFSSGMLKEAKWKNSNYKNITYSQKDITKLTNYHNKFEVAVAINSILMPSMVQCKKALKEAHSILKKGGRFIGVFPSLDADIHRANLTFEREYNKTKNEKEALRFTKNFMDTRSYDLWAGYFSNDGKQKHYFKSQLEHDLKLSGFKNIIIEKLYYDWKDCVDDCKYFRKFEPLWDWIVLAKK